jgi:predicted 3-demethylubiquinone-9 3-methyltransferase (glyoxalase superfamily)
MTKSKQMAICLWFDDQAEDAVRYYTSIFKDSKIERVSRYGKEGFEYHKKPVGTAMTVDFQLNGSKFIALNGGPQFVFNEAVSIVVYCDSQDEIDFYWTKLTAEGEEGPCGWLKDKFGVSWQIVPSSLPVYMADTDVVKSQRVAAAYLKMKKFNIQTLKSAFEGTTTDTSRSFS